MSASAPSRPDLAAPREVPANSTPRGAAPIAAAAVFAVAGLLLLPFLGIREFDSRAEARIPLVAMDMVATGRVVPPWLLGEPYLNKPPLHHLLVAAAIRALGRHDEWAVRLPSLLCGAAAVCLTWLLAARLRPPAGVPGGGSGLRAARMRAFVAAAFLLLAYRFFSLARSTELEILLAAATCLTYLGLGRILWPPEAADRAERARGWVLAASGTAIASLTKGPVIALIFPVAVLLSDAVITRSHRRILSIGAAGLVVAAIAGAAIYYVPLAAEIGGFAELRRRASFQNVLHDQPFHYYLWQLPLGLLPAGLLLPLMLLRLRRPDPVARTCALAVGIGVVVFSLSPSKQTHYLLPLYPLAAQWAARSVDPESWSPARRKAAVAGVLLAVAGMIAADVVRAREDPPTPATVMRDFAWMTRGKPVAMLERHPLLAYYLDRQDVVFPADPEAAARFADERWGFVIVDLEKRETLPAGVSRLAVLNQQEAKGHRYLLLTHRMHRATGVESATTPPQNR